MNKYQERGFANRENYLESLAEEYGMPLDDIEALADILGQGEDFDGLLAILDNQA